MTRIGVVALGFLVLVVGPAGARPIRVTVLDSAAAGRTVVVVGTVTRIRSYPPVGRRAGLQPLMLDVQVRVPLRLPVRAGSRSPRTIQVAHTRRMPNAQPMINAFSPVELRYGRTYLLFLQRDGRKGAYTLVSPEDPYLVEIPTYMPWVWTSIPPKGPVLDRASWLLLNLVRRCHRPCMAELWLLGNSGTFRKAPRFKHQRQMFVKALKQIAGASLDPNTLTAAWTVLGTYNVTSEIKHIVRYACHPPRRNRVTTPAGVIHWLQGYPDLVQIRALKRILRCARDPEVRRRARGRMQRRLRAHRASTRP